MSAKSKSALSDGTPNVSKTEAKPGADHSSSSSSLKSAQSRSRASVASNPKVKNPSPKPRAKAEKIKASRIVKSSELEVELNLAQQELKKANEKLFLLGKEKAKAIKQVKEAHKLSEAEQAKKIQKSALDYLKSVVKKMKKDKFSIIMLKRDVKESENRLELAKEKDYEAVKEIEIIKQEKSKLVDELEASRNEEEKSKKVINALTISTERAKGDYRDMKAEMERKEFYWTNTLKRSEEEKSCMEFEIKRLGNLVKKLEKEARGGTSEKEDTKSAKTRERENELRKNVSENGDSSEKDYDVLPKWTSFVQINGEEKEEEEEEDEDFAEGDIEMWESLKVDEKDAYTESEANGFLTRKKKPLLAKIGRLLKKDSAD